MRRRELAFFGYLPLSWFFFFVVFPLLLVLLLSFLTRGTYGGIEWSFTLDNYRRVFSGLYLDIFFKSLRLALSTSVICLLLAYPMAWAMATSSAAARRYWVLLLAVPFLTNLIIRVFALKLVMGIDGPVQAFLLWSGLDFDSFAFTQNQPLVMYGMITTYLPFMVFPIYGALEKFDFSLMEAALDLGASPLRAFIQIVVPVTAPAAVSGMTLVFIPSFGEFVIPDLLGGAKTMLVGNLITEQFLKARDWPFGASLSILLLFVLLSVPWVLRKLTTKRGLA